MNPKSRIWNLETTNRRMLVGRWFILTTLWLTATQGVADPADEALSRWDTETARRLLPPMQGADETTLARWGLIWFLDGDYAKAEEVLVRLARRGPFASLLQRARETRRLVKEFLQFPSPDQRFLVSVAAGPDEMAVPYIIEAAGAAYDDLTKRFGSGPTPPIRIEVAPTFSALSALSGVPEEALRETGTVGICRFRKVLIVSPAEFPHGYPYADTVAHEMVHFFWIARVGEGLPVWFQEAVAKYLETAWRGEPPGSLSSGLKTLLARAVAEGRLLPIPTLTAPLTSLERAEDVALAYAQLSSFAGFLVRNHGPDVLIRLGDRLASRGPHDPVAEVTGQPLKALAEEWARNLASVEPAPRAISADPLVLLREPLDEIRDSLPDFVSQQVRLGDLLRSEGRMEAAETRYRVALSATRTAHPLIVARLAATLRDLGRPAEALTVMDQSGLADDSFPPLARERGLALILLERPADALPALLSFVRTNPYDPAVHEGLARAWDALGQPVLAERERRLARFWR